MIVIGPCGRHCRISLLARGKVMGVQVIVLVEEAETVMASLPCYRQDFDVDFQK